MKSIFIKKKTLYGFLVAILFIGFVSATLEIGGVNTGAGGININPVGRNTSGNGSSGGANFTSFASPDGSLNVLSPAGAVQATLNTSHINNWTVEQYFSSIYANSYFNLAGNQIIDDRGNLFYIWLSNPLTDSDGTLFYSNGFPLADSAGNLHVGNNDITFLDNQSNIFNINNLNASHLIGEGSQITNLTIPEGITGTGTGGYICMFNTSNQINNSIVFQLKNRIGLNTTSPQAIISIGSGTPTGTQASPANQWGLFLNSSFDASFNGYTTLGGAVYISAATLSFPMGYAEAASHENKLGLDYNALVIGNNPNRHADYGHGDEANPTLYIQSSTAPTTNSTQWISITRDNTTSTISTGSGPIILNAANGMTTVKNITADLYFGDGSQLTNLPQQQTYKGIAYWHINNSANATFNRWMPLGVLGGNPLANFATSNKSRIYLTLFMTGAGGCIENISMNVASGTNATAQFQYGFYNSTSDLAPDKLLWNSSLFNFTAIGTYSQSIDYCFPPNQIYYSAYHTSFNQYSGSPAVKGVAQASAQSQILGCNDLFNGVCAGGMTSDYNWDATTPLPASITNYAMIESSGMPVLAVKYA